VEFIEPRDWMGVGLLNNERDRPMNYEPLPDKTTGLGCSLLFRQVPERQDSGNYDLRSFKHCKAEIAKARIEGED